jgi:hypothetical protein
MLINPNTPKTRAVCINDIPIGSVFSVAGRIYLRLINTIDKNNARGVALSSNSGVHVWRLNHILYEVTLYPNAILHLGGES